MSIGEHPHSIYKDLYGEKLIVSVTYENERISIKKKQLTLCVTFLACGSWVNLWSFKGFTANGLLSVYKVYQG